MRKTLYAVFMLMLPVTYGAESSYHFSLHDTATVNGMQLKPGDYRLQVEGDKATIKFGKTVVEAAVKIETADHKFKNTLVGFERTTSGLKISEIDIGGSTTRIVFSGTAAGQ